MTRSEPGALVLVATPIGNLQDLSPRAGSVLGAADLVLAEDTRRVRILLELVGARTRPLRFDEHTEGGRLESVLKRIAAGETVALVSDAGTPAISDPGYRLVRACHERGLRVTTTPGPCAAIAALSIAGLPTDRFLFAGYPPRGDGPRRRFFTGFATVPATLVFYESPHRIAGTVAAAAEVLGPRTAVLVRELTKIHEEVRRAPLPQLLATLQERKPRGEIVLLVEGVPRRTRRTRSSQDDSDPGFLAPGSTAGPVR